MVVKIGTSKYRNSGHYTSFRQLLLRLDLMRVEEMGREGLKCTYMYGLLYAGSGVCCFSPLLQEVFSGYSGFPSFKKILKSWFVTERTHVDKFLRTFKCFVAKKNNDTNQNENEPSQCTYYPLFKLFLLPMTILSFLSVPSISVVNSTNKSSVLCSLMFYWCPDPFNS